MSKQHGQPLKLWRSIGPRHYFDQLTARRVGYNRPRIVFRDGHGEGEDILSTSDRPYFILGVRKSTGVIEKVSWHHDYDAAYKRFGYLAGRVGLERFSYTALAMVDATEVKR